METVKKRQSFLINVLYMATIVGLFYLFIKYAFWPLSPIIIAFTIAVLLQKPVDKLCNKFKFRKGIVSTIMVLLVIGILITFMVFIGFKIVDEFKDFSKFISVRLKDVDWIERTVRSAYGVLPSFIQKTFGDSVETFLIGMRETFESGGTAGDVASTKINSLNISSILSPSIAGVLNTAKQIPTVLIAIVVTIVACCFMTADYERISGLIKSLFPEEKRYVFSRTKSILLTSLGKLAKAYAILIFITFTEMLIGLTIMQVMGIYKSSYMFVIAIITAIVDILPIFGTGTILIPWSIYELITKNTSFGIGLIVLYIAITIIRQIIEPKLVATQLDLPPALTICAMYVGLQLFGIIGMFLLPITLFCVKLLSDEGIIKLKKSEAPKIKERRNL